MNISAPIIGLIFAGAYLAVLLDSGFPLWVEILLLFAGYGGKYLVEYLISGLGGHIDPNLLPVAAPLD